ncbi:hypothetical protein DOF42_24570, partial [Salmonella enterica]|nr:hypothetical protein [Salmonella enterica]
CNSLLHDSPLFTYFRYVIKYTFCSRKNLPRIVNTVNQLTVTELTVRRRYPHISYMYFLVHFTDVCFQSLKRILLSRH